MDARPALSVQRSGASQLSEFGASHALSSSFPVFPTPLQESGPRFSDPHLVSVGREVQQRSQAAVSQLSSNSGVVGQAFSSSSGFYTDLHFSSTRQDEKHPRQSPFISQSASSGKSVIQSIETGVLHSTASSQVNRENSNSWCTDVLPDFSDFPMGNTIQNNQPDGSMSDDIAIPPEDLSKRNDWQVWADQLITDNDTYTPDWNDLLADANAANPEPRVDLCA